MGSDALTWQQYTGMTYTQAFPGNPIKVNGYFLDYTFNSGSDTISFPGNPVIPGAGLGGFFFTGSACLLNARIDFTILACGGSCIMPACPCSI